MNQDTTDVAIAQPIQPIQSNKYSSTYCSIKANTPEEKMVIYNGLNTCDHLLNDFEGQIITIKDVYMQEFEGIDKNTNESTMKRRVIIFDKDNKTYVTGSSFIFNALKQLFAIFGTPDTWPEPLYVKVTKKQVNDGKALNLVIVNKDEA